MSPLLNALKQTDTTPTSANRSVMVITCPDVCQFPPLLSSSEQTPIVYFQSFDFLLGVLDPKNMPTLWDQIASALIFYHITDVILLAHYPCTLMETLRQNPLDSTASPALSDALAQVKQYLATHAKPDLPLSRSFVCQFMATTQLGFLSHPKIAMLNRNHKLTLHTWLFDEEEQTVYASSLDDKQMVKLIKVA